MLSVKIYFLFKGNLIPLLKAKKCSKIKPNFVIYDPIYRINNQEKVIATNSK